MKITAQLSGVNRPLSVELRLINFFSCDLDSQEEHDTSPSRQLFSNRSDFCSAEELVQYSPFGGVEIGAIAKPNAMIRTAAIHGRSAPWRDRLPLIGEHVHFGLCGSPADSGGDPGDHNIFAVRISVFFFQARRRPPSMIDSVP